HTVMLILPSLGTLVVFGLVRPTRWLRSKVTRGNNEWLLRKPILRSSVIVVMALWNTADRHLLQATVGHKSEKSYAIIGASNLFGAALEKATSALAQLEGELSRRSETASAHLGNNSVATILALILIALNSFPVRN
nr:hypothetical protein [Tanacetum cinerariifolium]